MSDQAPKPNNQAINLYSVYSDELARMHELVKMYLQLPKDPYNGINRHGGYGSPHDNLGVFYQRIVELQNILIAALQSHDPLIQEKVAELALTGNIPAPSGDIPF